MKAETIFYNGRIHTVDKENPWATAVAIADGKFIAVGTDQEIMQMAAGDTKVIDLKKKTAITGHQ
jgi:predicted amidohydrolase YtcJ